ncbi:MAG TPA: hypothetical protein PK760_00495 [Flavobacteriales bacterium]|nr:hypothetical protein [Flavobacteriales bacterium]
MGLTDTLSINCRKATELIERRTLRKLGVLARIGLWYHMSICTGCRSYEKQSVVIDQWLEAKRDGFNPASDVDLQEKILRRIDDQA